MDIIPEGTVIEFLESQRFITATVIGRKGSRVRILTHTGREINLAPGRIIAASRKKIPVSDRNSTILALQSTNARREKLKEQINITEVWEAVNEDAESWPPQDLAELAFDGEITDDHIAAFLRAVIDDHTYFKYRDGMINVMPPVVVERLLEQRTREAKRLERISKGARWLDAVWKDEDTGTLGEEFEDAIQEFWIPALKDYCIQGDDSDYAPSVKGLLKYAGLSDSSSAFETLVRAGIWDKDENIELLRQGIEADFPPEVEKQAEELAVSIPNAVKENREDLRGLHLVTIDGAESKDLDDALSFCKKGEGWEIGIHITDISDEIKTGTPLFNEAINRATSIYLPEQQIPMLPDILSHNRWSLVQGEDRRGLSFFITIDNEGQILNSRISRSLINVARRMSYREAEEEILSGGTLSHLHELCKKMQQRRIENGALPLPIPELIINVTDGEVSVNLCRLGPARFLISECMILANVVAARFLRDNNIPGLYRSQPPPRQQIIFGEEEDLLANFRQRRLISRGHLGTEPEKHSGLGVDCYTTVTSPLRRGLDLLMQQQLTSFLQTGKPTHSEEELEQLAARLGAGLAAAAAVRQNRTRYWTLKYLESRKDEPLNAWILDKGRGNRLLVVLCDTLTPVEIPLRPQIEWAMDMEIQVRIKRIVPRENILKVDWWEAGGP